jgi:hypothetical protein
LIDRFNEVSLFELLTAPNDKDCEAGMKEITDVTQLILQDTQGAFHGMAGLALYAASAVAIGWYLRVAIKSIRWSNKHHSRAHVLPFPDRRTNSSQMGRFTA